MVHILVKSDCLPQFVYGCEIGPLNSANVLENGTVGFDLTAAGDWRESVFYSFIVKLCRYPLLQVSE